MTTLNVQGGVAYCFTFTNFKGEVAERNVIARSLQWGDTAWHKETQFFLEAFDLDKQEVRAFPVKEINVNSFRRLTDEELDVLLTQKIRDAVQEFKETLAHFKASVEEGNSND